jgi:hypothetical protein
MVGAETAHLSIVILAGQKREAEGHRDEQHKFADEQPVMKVVVSATIRK